MEIYKDVINYEGIYQVSNLGNVKSFRYGKERQMKQSKDSLGYLAIGIRLNNIHKKRRVHQLVAEAFLNHRRCGLKLVVNHIDFDKTNNKLDNLEIVTQRENSNHKHLKSTSQYVGVSWSESRNKWIALIYLNGKHKNLGRFNDELEASKAYQKALQGL